VRNVAAEGADAAMPDYRYELRRGEEVMATGRLSLEQPLEVGERITIGSRSGIVRDIEPLLSERELRLVVTSSAADHSAAVRRAQGVARPTGSQQNRGVLVCVECGCVSDEEASGWRAYREDVPGEDEPASVAIFCPICAAREFDAAPAE
jgi:hypothetical protein